MRLQQNVKLCKEKFPNNLLDIYRNEKLVLLSIRKKSVQFSGKEKKMGLNWFPKFRFWIVKFDKSNEDYKNIRPISQFQ
ncbi:MAG: hypothetical protein GBAus27B_000155 [Mycoplasmataceae bacterium]|nr:MAG: hypothetical protein GBAus27B_000155 [Mycoplasmataceae bacterium]